MTLNSKLSTMMDGKHVMDTGSASDRLSTYHDIQAVKKAMLIRRDQFERFTAIKRALKNYRLMVNFTSDDKARIFDPATRTEVIL
jgi:hypothetical protein